MNDGGFDEFLPRLKAAMSLVLDDIHDEDTSLRERIAALTAVARIITAFMSSMEKSNVGVGSTARSYANAFPSPYGANRGTSGRVANPTIPSPIPAGPDEDDCYP